MILPEGCSRSRMNPRIVMEQRLPLAVMVLHAEMVRN